MVDRSGGKSPRVSVSLDDRTLEQLERISGWWKVSKSAVVRSLLAQAVWMVSEPGTWDALTEEPAHVRKSRRLKALRKLRDGGASKKAAAARSKKARTTGQRRGAVGQSKTGARG